MLNIWLILKIFPKQLGEKSQLIPKSQKKLNKQIKAKNKIYHSPKKLNKIRYIVKNLKKEG